MTTVVSLQYRCQLPGGSKPGLPVFNDLSTARTGPLSARVGLGRLLTLARVIGDPVDVVIKDERDLADRMDQQAVAALLADSGSTLTIGGAVVSPDERSCAVLGELQQLARSAAWFAPERPDDDDDPSGRKNDLHSAVQSLVVGLDIKPPQVAALLNASPSWRPRSGSEQGFTRQSVSHYFDRSAGPPRPEIASLPIRGELKLAGQGNGILMIAGGAPTLAMSLVVAHEDALSGAQRVVLEAIFRRSGGDFTGYINAEPNAEERRQLDRVLDFVLDVVQGKFLDRLHPATNLAEAKRFARSQSHRRHQTIAAELDRAGYLTSSTYGKWSTSSVFHLLKPPKRPPSTDTVISDPASI